MNNECLHIFAENQLNISKKQVYKGIRKALTRAILSFLKTISVLVWNLWLSFYSSPIKFLKSQILFLLPKTYSCIKRHCKFSYYDKHIIRCLITKAKIHSVIFRIVKTIGRYDLNDQVQATYDWYDINFLKMLQVQGSHPFKHAYSHNPPFSAFNSNDRIYLRRKTLYSLLVKITLGCALSHHLFTGVLN